PLQAPPAGHTAYEALQPPLYYWLMTPAMFFSSLSAQVLAIRWMSIALASLLIPVVFFIGRLTFDDHRLALSTAAAVAVRRGRAIDVARVANDSLAILLFSLFIWLGLRPTTRRNQ